MRSTSAAADTTQTPSRPATLFAKVTTPFTSRRRNLSEFYIEPEEPHRQYSPSDVVKGCVNYKIDKAVNITHLLVCLHGFVKVFSNARVPFQDVPRDGAPLGTGNRTSKRGAEYFGNGFASLFEDEVVLCGQGRLLPGAYKFKFELELPSKGLPSSIDFERGTISYMLTSTLTKPTTISPRTNCHWKIKVVEAIDVALSQQPKPQTVSLEPVLKGIKGRSSTRRNTTTSGTHHSFPTTTDSAALRSSADPPQSPAQSETSTTSATSSSGLNWQVRSSSSLAKSSNGEYASKDYGGTGGISAIIEVLRGGCLPGDILPVQVSVTHTKPIKSLQGIIITLYRLARVDTHPAIPLGPRTRDKKPEYEDYYPKSRTGLGGLSLSSAGSSRAFRQDLNQTFAPLIVDPRSLTAVIKTSLQVPEDLFPTISNVPGQMITFKYYIEVVVDLRGRLAGQERVRSQLGIVNGAGGYGHGDPQVNGVDGSSGLFFPLASGFGCLDTSQIRREKSVVSWPFEVIVGTRDSDRKRSQLGGNLPTPEAVTSHPGVSAQNSIAAVDADGGQPKEQALSTPYRHAPHAYFEIPQRLVSSPQYTVAAHTAIIPPPEEDSDECDEKTRLKRAEQRLLPSEPPVGDEQGPSMPAQPSAPAAIDDEDFVNRYRVHQPMPENSPTIPRDTIVPSSSQSDPTLNAESALVTPPSVSNPNDDKQELEMRRLQEEASSPGASESLPSSLEPTAPTLNDNTSICAQRTPPTIAEFSEGEHLPMYRR